jgi:hypothetical protein
MIEVIFTFKKAGIFEKAASRNMVRIIAALMSLAALVLSCGSYLTWR